MSPEPRQTRSEQREAARQKARELREQNKRKATIRKTATRAGIAVGVLAVVGALVAVLFTGAQQQNNGTASPANLFNDGVKVGVGLQAFTSTQTPTPSPDPTATAEVPNIIMFVDYQCPVCGGFEAANSAQITSWVETGAATVEIHPISFLDGASANNYSSRAANAAMCVANYDPNLFFEFSAKLFENQPAEQTAGPDNAGLISTAAEVGVNTSDSFKSCVEQKKYGSWVDSATTKALTKTIPGFGVEKPGTPTIVVNNKVYTWATGNELVDPARFANFVQQAMAAN